MVGRRGVLHCDNLAVADSGLLHSVDLMKLVCSLFFIAAKQNFHTLIKHNTSTNNVVADSLSRMQMERFRELAPLAAPTATPTPASLMFI